MNRTLSLLCLAAATFGSASPIDAQSLSDAERAIVARVEANADAALDLLQRVVSINSGTMSHAGVREVGRVFAEEFEAIGFTTRWIDMPPEVNRAGHLFASIDGGRGPHVLLIGHLDTVFEEDSPFQRFERDGDRARGPGVDDMKGGDVIAVFALKALREAGVLEGARITVAFTGDEESPGSPLEIARRDLIEAGRAADIALGFEGSVGSPQSATVARRGSSGWTLRVSGRRAHSSGIFSPRVGSGAIFEAARILNAFHDELRDEEYLSFNPGVILGGTEVDYDATVNRGSAFGKTNVVAQDVVVQGGLRFISEGQKERARERMREIVSRHHPQTAAAIEFTDGYPAMPPTEGNQALFERLDRVSRDLGLGPVDPVDPGARGAADISFVAPYTDGLAGIGAFGSGSHTVEEDIHLDSIRTATLKAAVLIYRLTHGS